MDHSGNSAYGLQLYRRDLDDTNYHRAIAVPATSTGVTVDTDADILGDMTVANNSGTYTLSYTDSDGNTQSVTGTLDTTANTLTFTVDSLDGTSGGSSVVIDTSSSSAFSLPSTGSTVDAGTTTAATKKISISTYDASGAAVTKTATWTSPNTTISLGDITLTVDSAKLAALEDMTDKTIGSAGAGDGTTVTIGYIAVCSFSNADGLSQDGEGYYVETTNSGDAVATTAGNSGTGTLLAGALESSNVDLSQQLTEMIITQRGFQANSKMITVSDEMLETLVNMKR